MRIRLNKRRLMRQLLPEALVFRLWRWRTARAPRSALPTASGHRTITIQDGIDLDVFWVSRELGPGPGASLYVLGDEVLRLDCFGSHGLGGHYHINPQQTRLYAEETARLFFPAGGHEDHVERAAFELAHNLPAMLAMNRDAEIRAIELDGPRLAQAADEMRRFMLELLARHRDELAEEPAPVVRSLRS